MTNVIFDYPTIERLVALGKESIPPKRVTSESNVWRVLLCFFVVSSSVRVSATDLQDILLPSSKNLNDSTVVAKREKVLLLPPVELNDLSSAQLAKATDRIKLSFRDAYPAYQLIEWRDARQTPNKQASQEQLQDVLVDVAIDMKASRWEGARKKLLGAIETYLAAVRSVDDFLFVLKAREKLLEVYLRLAQIEDARNEMLAILCADLDFVFNPLYFASVWIDEAEAIRKRLKSAPRTKLSFARRFPNSRIFVDGRMMGEAPLQVLDLLPGPHWVKIETPYDEIVTQKLNLSQDLQFESSVDSDLSFPSKLAQTLLAKSWSSELSNVFKEEAKHFQADKIVAPIASSQDDQIRIDLVLYDAAQMRFASLGNIFTSTNLSRATLLAATELHFESEWNAHWLDQADELSVQGKTAFANVSFAQATKTPDKRDDTIAQVADPHKRRILTIASRAIEDSVQATNEGGATSQKSQLWFWMAVSGASAVALGASAVALYFLIPKNQNPSTDLDFTIGQR